MVHDFFNNSNAQFASYFTKETDLTREELEDLRKLIDEKLDKR
jgi:predicted transcriptional regulator